MKWLRMLAGVLIAAVAPLMGVQAICQAWTRGLCSVADWLLLAKGVVLVLTGVLAVVGIAIWCLVGHADRQKAARRKADPNAWPDAAKEAVRAQWTPEHPKPQTVDWDDGTCPYRRDAAKPLGSKENPVVAGIPSASTHLVFSSERGCWILTDGLGNGWIR